MRNWCLILTLSFVLHLSLPGSSFAEKKPGGGGDTTKHADEEKPNPFKGTLDLSIWTLVVFLSLAIVLGKVAWPKMLKGLDERERNIAAAVEDARKAREDAAAARQLATEIEARSNEKARQLIEEARKSADELQAKRKIEFDAEMGAERERFRREMTIAKDQAIKEMMTQSAQLATLVSSKVIRRQLSADDHRALVDEALGDMNRAFEARKQALSAGAHA